MNFGRVQSSDRERRGQAVAYASGSDGEMASSASREAAASKSGVWRPSTNEE